MYRACGRLSADCGGETGAMKFSSLNRTGLKAFKVKDFSGGVNLCKTPSGISDSELSAVKNMQYESGVLTARPGILASDGDIIENEEISNYYLISYRVTDTAVYINGEYKKIAVASYCESDAHYFCYIYFLGADGSKTPAGYINYNRISNDCFYQPTSLLFYSGAPVNGGGIFALVTAKDIYDETEYSYRIFEISADMTAWAEPTSFYTPVVYINGRGNRYEEAKATNWAYTGQPKILESRNMLTGRFKAYFTSDGYSSCFRLPFTSLASETVICRVYTAPDKYTEWFIEGYASSATATFYTADITLNVDRSKGMIYFTDSEGEYPVPMMSKYHENNICVTAGKKIENGFNKAASSTCCAAFDSKIIFSGGCDKGRVFCVSASNPLYFPEDSTAAVGTKERGINALLAYKNGIIAYKEDEIYALTVKKGEAINSTSLLADNDSVFYKSDSFSVKRVDGNIGCVNKNSAVICGNTPVWLGNDGEVYSLNISSWEMSRLSAAIKPYLAEIGAGELQKACASGDGSQYMLMIGSKAVIMEYSQNELKAGGVKWYIWDFGGIKMLGAAKSGEKQRFFCTGSDGNILYSAVLSGENDTDICIGGEGYVINTRKIPCSVTTKCFDFGSPAVKKLIDNILLSVSSCGELDIALNGKHFDRLRLNNPDIDCGCGAFKSVKIIPHLYGTQSLCMTFSSDSGFSIGELIINYREAR